MSQPLNPSTHRSRPRLLGFLSGLVAGLVLTAGSGLALSAVLDPGPCPRGQAPATNPSVTSQCFERDAALPSGYTWDD